MTPLVAQLRAELTMTLRRGESVLLTLGIPALLLVFFSKVDVLPHDSAAKAPVDFLAPGILALAVLSAAFVGVAIATAFERQYGVLKRIGTTPLGRERLLIAKIGAVIAVEAIQVVVIVLVGMALGWRPEAAGVAAGSAAVLVGTAAFAGLALVIAGRQRAEMVLASANGAYLVLLLISGIMIPLAKLPGALRSFARLLPSTALADILRSVLGPGHTHRSSWPVLVAWAVGAPLLAARLFRWE